MGQTTARWQAWRQATVTVMPQECCEGGSARDCKSCRRERLCTKKWLGARQNPLMSKQFLSCKLAVTGPRMCSHSRLTLIQFSSAAHQKYLFLSCFFSICRPFFTTVLVYLIMRQLFKHINTFLRLKNDLVATPNLPLLLPASALPKEATRYDVSDYIIQTGTRNLHVRSFTSSWRFRVPMVRLAVPLRHKVQSLQVK